MADVTVSQRALGSKDEADPAAEQIARAIEKDIFAGRLKPGEKLGEEELAERFGASRHHVREGLARLILAGIIVKERNKGASVRRFGPDELRQIYEIREILQRQAALRIPLPAEAAAIHRLTLINEEFEAAAKQADFRRIHVLNDRFHTELFGLCDNDLLVSLIKTYMDLTYAVRGAAFANPRNLEKSRTQHRIMIQLLSGSDSWALAQICVDHIQITKDQYLAAIGGPEASRARIGVG
ncbi:MAG TPA: GntR family transcriptional regulator [Roseiarcus sp.]|jgi:DNA-binding GntR family transcriptional regulator|nr:GntR family transcriptional regulator [Roseiarcus sp.]